MTDPRNEHSLIKIYGYEDSDDFGFKEFIYEGVTYDTQREREEAWANNEII